MSTSDTARIRELNDAFRRNPHLLGRFGQLLVTQGVAARGIEFVDRAARAVREYETFTKDNDPFGEHDFGAFEIDGEKLFWTNDCYDNDLNYGSPNAANPSVTRRVLTIMLAAEY
jgi:hypothetical protein